MSFSEYKVKEVKSNLAKLLAMENLQVEVCLARRSSSAKRKNGSDAEPRGNATAMGHVQAVATRQQAHR